ncbi:MAG: hypothetical protein V9H69_25280 [Anaerolineae bacterium]
MRSNGHSEAPGSGVLRTADALSHVRWQTDETIALPMGAVRASGDASPQVRSPQRLAAVGDVTAQIAHIRRAIVEALTGALEGMEPTADDLHSHRGRDRLADAGGRQQTAGRAERSAAGSADWRDHAVPVNGIHRLNLKKPPHGLSEPLPSA